MVVEGASAADAEEDGRRILVEMGPGRWPAEPSASGIFRLLLPSSLSSSPSSSSSCPEPAPRAAGHVLRPLLCTGRAGYWDVEPKSTAVDAVRDDQVDGLRPSRPQSFVTSHQ